MSPSVDVNPLNSTQNRIKSKITWSKTNYRWISDKKDKSFCVSISCKCDDVLNSPGMFGRRGEAAPPIRTGDSGVQYVDAIMGLTKAHVDVENLLSIKAQTF